MSRPVLVDTSAWVEHLRAGNDRLVALLEAGHVRVHPMVIGELACGRLSRPREILAWLNELPAVITASHEEVLAFIDRQRLMGTGIGYVDVHLLAATRLTASARLWTCDRRLQAVAATLGLAA